jgi:hypothetical protein
MSSVCFYVDNSNIFHEGQRFAEQKAGERRQDFRIYFKNFVKLAVKEREVKEVVWGGSVPPPDDTVWAFLREELGIEPELLPRAAGGEHETVDHLIQLRMHRHVRKYRESPGTIILATGDGKGYYQEDGFLYDLEGFVEDGWGIELLSWEHSCHRKLREFAENRGRFISLDAHYDQITFVKGGRVVMPLT